MGAVYLAQDSTLGRQVALKIPFFDAKESPQRAERFIREARSAAALHHPNICTVFDAGRIAGTPFLTMGLIKGTPLDRAIDPESPMPQPRAAEIARKVAFGLAHAHGKGIVHRDLKPANVMLDEDGEPVVMDFGLAKRGTGVDPNEAKLTRDSGILGTPSYMSPEQVRGDADVGPASDVYSLGVLLFEMLTGHTPYSGGMGAVLGQILAAPVPPLSESRPDADPRLNEICQRAMAKQPVSRFPSMTAFAQSLSDYLSSIATPIISVERVEPPPRQQPALPVVTATQTYHPSSVTTSSPFDRLTDEDDTSRRPIRREVKPVKGTWGAGRIGILAGIALAMLVPLVWLASVVLRMETPNGTLVVEIKDPDVEARIKDGKLILSTGDGKTQYTLFSGERDKKLDVGSYKIRVEGADGLSLDTTEFTLKKGEKITVRVTLDPKPVVSSEPPKRQASDDQWQSLTQPGLVDWIQNKSEWKEAKSVSLDPVDDTKFRVQPGTGVLYCLAGGNDSKNLISKSKFQDFEFKAEFLVSKRGGSGVFFMQHYELQIGDSWGLNAKPTVYDSGGIFPCFANGAPLKADQYGTPPNENASRPPGEWQSYEVAFQAPRFDQAGKLTSPARFLRVVHNGRVIHQNIDVGTPSPKMGPEAIFLQGGFGAIAFRNVKIRTLPSINEPLPRTTDPDRKAAEYAKFKNNIGMEFVKVPKGKSWLGGSGGKTLGDVVEIKQDYFIGKYPVTQAEWMAVTGKNPSHFSRTGPGKEVIKNMTDAALARLPVEMVSWDDCQDFVKQLNEKAKESGWTYRLPTGAEWEYACRGGPQTDRNEASFDYYFDKPSNELLTTHANFDKRDAGWTSLVDAYPANRLGLHDMHGNVHQWCADLGQESRFRVIRGGSFWSPPGVCRAASVAQLDATTKQFNIGLRLVRVP